MNTNILAYEIDVNDPNLLLVFCEDNCLYQFNRQNADFSLIAKLENLTQKDTILIYQHSDYVCVAENFATQGAVVNRCNGNVMPISREDYHADVSSYSIGFLERNGHTLLIHQTDWNRLDITDLTTGQLLTDRIIRNERTGVDEKGNIRFDEENYLNYFHSLVHVSPNGRSFLSNGWVWQPCGVVLWFNVERFMQTFELSEISSGHTAENQDNIYSVITENWDIPCTFIDDDIYALACGEEIEQDNPQENGKSRYTQRLFFYDIRNEPQNKVFVPIKTVEVDVFPMNEYGEVSGCLFYDQKSNQLIAMSTQGTSVLTLDGKIIANQSHLAIPRWTPPCWQQLHPAFDGVAWKYSVEYRLFYTFDHESLDTKVVPLDDLLNER